MKKTTSSSRRMSYWTWVENFRPIRNIFDETMPIDGYLFQPYGEQWEFVKQHDLRYVWTLIITDLPRSSIWEITNGIHIVNREGFLVTEMPFIGDTYCNVRY